MEGRLQVMSLSCAPSTFLLRLVLVRHAVTFVQSEEYGVVAMRTRPVWPKRVRTWTIILGETFFDIAHVFGRKIIWRSQLCRSATLFEPTGRPREYT